MTVEEFERELANFGESIRDLSPILDELANEIASQIRQDAPYDTGALRNSIRTFVSYNSFELTMLYYGAFQNYGVNGTEQNIANRVEFGVEPRPSSEPFYAFKTRRYGLQPRGFFNITDIEDLIVSRLETQISEEL
jgi:hypothetical protein